MNDEMDDFDAEVGTANEVQPGKRPMSSMSPTIILKDGKPVMTDGKETPILEWMAAQKKA